MSTADALSGGGPPAERHAVVIAGGGPTGLMLAGELALAGVDVAIVERRASQDLDSSRAGGLHARTIEVLDQRGIADRFLAAGEAMQVQAFAMIRLDISDFPTRYNYGLALWQSRFEPILADWVIELDVPIYRGREVDGLAQDDTGVDVHIAGGQTLRADYLVGCDGGHSLIRRAAGIDFPGLDPSTSWLIAEVEMDEDPEPGIRRDSLGTHGLNRTEDGGPVRAVLTERLPQHTADPSMDELLEALVSVFGTDYKAHSPRWISRFTDMTRQAASYRRGRVLLAGDAAHVHPPHGGQGLNTGVQDAVNLGWKLAQVVTNTSPESLLDTYHAERHPVGARVLHNTMAQVALNSDGERHQALRDIMTDLLSMDEPRTRIAAMLAGLDIHYDLGDGHQLLGRRMPDLDLHTADGPTRVFTLLHDARPVLLNLGEPGGFDIGPWADRVRLVDARHDGVWELPVIGEVTAPAAVLIRPDGHVAWAGDLTDPARRRHLRPGSGRPPRPRPNSRAPSRPSRGPVGVRRPNVICRDGDPADDTDPTDEWVDVVVCRVLDGYRPRRAGSVHSTTTADAGMEQIPLMVSSHCPFTSARLSITRTMRRPPPRPPSTHVLIGGCPVRRLIRRCWRSCSSAGADEGVCISG